MKNKIEDLRNHLFVQLERLQDDDLDLSKEIDRAGAMVEIAAQIIDSARAETEFLRLSDPHLPNGTEFIPLPFQKKQLSGSKDEKIDSA